MPRRRALLATDFFTVDTVLFRRYYVLFTIDTLVNMLTAAGLHLDLRVGEAS